jgi:hypothetical protein
MAAITAQFKVLARAKWELEQEPPPWGEWLISPAPGYLESASQGPIPFREVEWVEINMTRIIRKGQRVPDVKIDVSVELVKSLAGFHFSVEAATNVVRVYPHRWPLKKPSRNSRLTC